jgi:transposase-like protein
MTNLTNPIFTDEDKAREHFEALRWADGVYCPKCGATENIKKLEGRTTRPGLHICNSCRAQFSVTMGTVMERSHIKLTKWALGFHLYAASKKGLSAHQLHRMLGITYRSAWFMAHRIREAMNENDGSPMGGEGEIIEADEVYVGPGEYVFKSGKGWMKMQGTGGKARVVTLIERGGRARSIKVENLTALNVSRIILENASTDSKLYTDEANFYPAIGKKFAAHETVNHGSKEYARGAVTTNTVEGFFGLFRRGMKGVYQHCSEKHLQRYFWEFDFRYSNRIALGVSDTERAARLVKNAGGKRLMYNQPNFAHA